MNMQIHKGIKYTICAEGNSVRKSDGVTEVTMPYYPERDASALAGEIDELTAWRILHDVAAQAQGSDTPVEPEHIMIDGAGFILNPFSRSLDTKFTAPEGYEAVWALGASVFYIFLGCHVFQGLGGKGETPTAPIPTLRRELPELSGLIAACLAYDPKRRPSLQRIVEVADYNLVRCGRNVMEFPPKKRNYETGISSDDLDYGWPEEMD